MNNPKKMLAEIIAVISAVTSAVSCSADKSHKTGSLSILETTSVQITEPTTTIPETTETTTSPPEPVPLEDPVDISGTEIVWLSDYDLNPTENANRSVALSLFEDVYGGKIKYVSTSARNKFTTLSSMLLAGEEVDMFEYEPSDFPKGVLSKQYQPLDPYFRSMGFNYGIWEDMEDVIDSLEYNGKHYVIPYSLSNPTVMTYSRKIIKDNKLDDPYELYKKGKWDWDSFIELSEKYRKKTGNHAVRGDLGNALIHSTGSRVIDYKNGKLVNNINNAKIRTAELFMQDINEKSLYSSYWNEYYTSDTLFFVYDSWTLGTSNVKNPDMDLMVVPVPKSPDTDGNYIMCDFNAKMLVRNSRKGDAVATYIQCERIASTQEEYKQGAKEYALIPETSSNGTVKSYITEEQYDALQEFIDLEKVTPVYDYISGMGDRLSGSGGVMESISNTFLINGGSETDWKNLRNSCSDIIKEVLQEYW
ncbi:MAG: ABC transporter substrate-binding protein [Ruminococcus flavefaciens]|nr:ABC transporter substrate-binding protein [Ruminococcus flavefaciens]